MHYIGEIISLVVAVSWTITALFAEMASRQLTPLILNVIRMLMSLAMLSVAILFFTGHFFPLYADHVTWFWLMLSGVVGYVFGDTCLFNSYVIIGSRFGQLFMTLAPPTAAITGFLFLGERMSVQSLFGMAITLLGIGISIMNKSDGHKVGFKLPLKGILYGIGAGIGQGGGLVLSKIGINHYVSVIPVAATASIAAVPFSATFMRAIAGLIGFVIILRIRRDHRYFLSAIRNRKGMWNAVGLTFFGPFLGVSLSLMAVQYTSTGIASTLMALTPIMIILPSKYIFKQKVTLKEVFGAFVSVVGVSLFFV